MRADWFGKGPNECVGKQFNTLAVEQDSLLKLLDAAQSAKCVVGVVGAVGGGQDRAG